jgi:hypothetical protein
MRDDRQNEIIMIHTIMQVLFGCRHKRITRPITPVDKARQSSQTYVACLDCGKQFKYDATAMRIGREISPATASASAHFQTSV